MKLLSHEQKDLMHLLDEAGIDDHFHFIKKKGWVTINLINRKDTFSFHRKKTTELIDGHFQNSTTYFVSIGKERSEHQVWDTVVKEFGRWLNSGEKSP